MGIVHLYLKDFRIHKEFSCDVASDFVFVEGPNGAGKTSILEAISLLAPGKGLRHAEFGDVVRVGGGGNWAAFFRLSCDTEVGMEYAGSGRRVVRMDGKLLRSSAHLLDVIKVLWLTPAEDGTLAESKTLRRKFLDRLVYNFMPAHAQNVSRYEYFLKSRLKLLKSESYDPLWMQQIEEKLAEESQKINAARLCAITRLQEELIKNQGLFLVPSIDLICQVGANDDGGSIAEKFKLSRALDAKVGRSFYGVHRADFVVRNPTRLDSASRASTGELKLMLLSLIIAQISCLNKKEGISPILLLDDIFSHLDSANSNKLMEQLTQLKAQLWISGTSFINPGVKHICKKYVKIHI